MSSLVIAIGVGYSHITGTLVRVDQWFDRSLSIERDIFHTHSIENDANNDPRYMISILIRCIDGLIHDLIDNYHTNDNLVSIVVALPGQVDSERGISYVQSPHINKFKHFFGLNLRLSLEYGIQDLVSHWKKSYFSKININENLTTKSNSLDDKNHMPRKKTVKYSLLPSTLTNSLSINSLISKSNNLINYCGLYDNQSCGDIDSSCSKRNSSCSTQLCSVIEKLSRIQITFYNNATCFAIGEIKNFYDKNCKRVLALMINSSLDSTFIEDGEIISYRHDVPPGGMLSNYPYDDNSTADDWFSIRGLMNIYKKVLQDDLSNENFNLSINKTPNYTSNQLDITQYYTLIKEASDGDEDAIRTFKIYAELLGEFLLTHIKRFRADLLLIGGDIVHSWYLLENDLNAIIKQFYQIEIYFSLSYEKSICFGAVLQKVPTLFKMRSDIFRQTDQDVLPVLQLHNSNQSNSYSSHEIPIGYIGIGYRKLNERMFRLIKENSILLIDGFIGTYFDEYASQLNQYFYEQIKTKYSSSILLFYDTQIIFKNNQNSIDSNKLNYLKNNMSIPCVVIGPGASYINDISPLVYIDLPKIELYYRSERKNVVLKSNQLIQNDTSSKMNNEYELIKISHKQTNLNLFDYIKFEKIRQEVFFRLTFYVDGQRPHCPTWIHGHTMRQALAHIADEPISLRPGFNLNPLIGADSVNRLPYSLKLLTSENGILLSDANSHLLEFCLNLLYISQISRILGNYTHYRLFSESNRFPINFNIIHSAIERRNSNSQYLSKNQFTRKVFEENRTKNRTYYVIQTDKETKFSNKSSSFIDLIRDDKELLQNHRKQSDLTFYSSNQAMLTNKHDIIFIPNGMNYTSYQNQILLEISSNFDTHTFKLNTSFNSYRTKTLKPNQQHKQYICQPVSIEIKRNQYEIQHIRTNNSCIYELYRIIMTSDQLLELVQSTENRFHLCILVEGDAVRIQFTSTIYRQEKRILTYDYMQTFLIPATIKQYSITPIIKTSENRFHQHVLLIACLKWNIAESTQNRKLT